MNYEESGQDHFSSALSCLLLKIINFQCFKGGMWRDNPRPPDSLYDVTNMDNHGKTVQGWGLTKFIVAGQNLTEIEITVRFKDDMMGQ